MQVPFIDGLRNYVANLATGRDKASHSTYTNHTIDDAQLVAMYRTSAIAKKIVDLPAEDSLREWREWQASAAQISALEAEEKRLGLQANLIRAAKRGRLFGGAALFIGTGDTDLMKPLNPERIGSGGLKYISVLNRADLTSSALERDPRLTGYGKPKFYTMNTDGGQVTIHPSRLVLLQGDELPDDRFAGASLGWSDPVITSCLTAVRDNDASLANVASLMFEAKINVIGVKGLTEGLRSGGGEFERQILARQSLNATAKGINGDLLMDTDDTFTTRSASFATLPDIMDRFMQACSAAASIPMTLLFGMSPGGLNASGDADTRGYYDRIKVMQALELQPSMQILDECLIRSALGSRPDDVFYNWRPLWMPTTKERAETGKLIADTFKIVSEMDLLPPEAVANAVVNGLTESGLAPGLEGDVTEFFEGNGRDTPDDVIEGTVADATPQTLYVYRKLLNGADVIRWAKSQGFKTTLPASDMHVTIAFSRAPVDWMECGTSYQSKLEVSAGGPRLIEQFGDARVLLFTDGDLKWRHEEIKGAGATWDHPEYQPHVTISYDPDAPDIADIEPYTGPLIFGPEIFQTVKDNWKEGIEET
ncbi:MAG: DUF1073 domain-containing protein [Sulfitobacter litoralis]|nr:DUF1073 domain-containing protein [Sulfitobacter litoralis]